MAISSHPQQGSYWRTHTKCFPNTTDLSVSTKAVVTEHTRIFTNFVKNMFRVLTNRKQEWFVGENRGAKRRAMQVANDRSFTSLVYVELRRSK